MKINVFPLSSILSDKNFINKEIENFINVLNLEDSDNSYKLVNSFDKLYESDLSLILISTGGSEEIFIKYLNQIKEPIYLLTYGYNNSLAASIEILTYLNSNNLKGRILHGSNKEIIKMINSLNK